MHEHQSLRPYLNEYSFRYILTPDNETLIMDLAFPPTKAFDSDRKQVYLFLTGINGNSHEGYVVDNVSRLVNDGHICAVLNSRGLGDSRTNGQNLLHFARTSDVALAAQSLRRATPSLIVGIGYSMGAIQLANYVAVAGDSVPLDAAVGFSGALDTRLQPMFERSARLWQPFITRVSWKHYSDNCLSQATIN